MSRRTPSACPGGMVEVLRRVVPFVRVTSSVAGGPNGGRFFQKSPRASRERQRPEFRTPLRSLTLPARLLHLQYDPLLLQFPPLGRAEPLAARPRHPPLAPALGA